jgi:hypothetical protein
MISVVMSQENLDLQPAVDFVGDLCNRCVDRFNAARNSLPSWGPAIDKDIAVYVDGLANWMVGNLHWSVTIPFSTFVELLTIRPSQDL